MASPIAGSAFTFTLSLLSQTDGTIVANPTLATGDVKISTDGGAFANLATLPTVTPASGGTVEVNLTSGEVGNDHFTVAFTDQAGSEWKTTYYHETVQSTEAPTAADVADAVWDETYASHTTAGTFGKLMDILRKANRAIEGEVSGTPTTTAFDTNLTGYTTGAFDSEVLVFVSGSINGEARPILSYSSTNGRVTFEEPWTAAPTASDEFVIIPYHVHAISEIASGIWSESQSSYTTNGTFGNYLDSKVSLAGGGSGGGVFYTDGPIVGRVIKDSTIKGTVSE